MVYSLDYGLDRLRRRRLGSWTESLEVVETLAREAGDAKSVRMDNNGSS